MASLGSRLYCYRYTNSFVVRELFQIVDFKQQWREQHSVMWSEKIFPANQQDVDLTTLKPLSPQSLRITLQHDSVNVHIIGLVYDVRESVHDS